MPYARKIGVSLWIAWRAAAQIRAFGQVLAYTGGLDVELAIALAAGVVVLSRALADPEVKQKLLAQGLEANGGTAAQFGKFIDDETRKWGEVIRAAGLKGE